MRATVVNCYPDHNKGSSAIAWGAANRLRGTGLVDHVDFVALWPHVDPAVDFRHLTDANPGSTVHPSPLTAMGGGHGSFTRAERVRNAAVALGQTMAVRARPVRSSLADRHAAFDAIRSSDLVVERGGPFMAGYGSFPNPSLLAYALPLVYAREHGIPFALLGESIGPLRGQWAQRVVTGLVADSLVTTLRDRRAAGLLQGLGVPADSATVSVDNAFWVEPRDTERLTRIRDQHGLTSGEFLAVTVALRPLDQVDGYLEQVASVIDALVPSVFPRAAIVPNLFVPGAPERDDRAVSRHLLSKVADQDSVALVEDDLPADEMAAFFGSAGVLLGTRLHSLILGLNGGTRVVAVSYGGPKTMGLMELLGLDDFVLHMDRFDTDDAIRLITRAVDGQPSVTDRVARLKADGDRALSQAVGSL